MPACGLQSLTCMVGRWRLPCRMCQVAAHKIQHSSCGRSLWLQHMPFNMMQHLLQAVPFVSLCRGPGRRKCCQGHLKWRVRPVKQPVQQKPDQSFMRPVCPAALGKFLSQVHVMPGSHGQLWLQRLQWCSWLTSRQRLWLWQNIKCKVHLDTCAQSQDMQPFKANSVSLEAAYKARRECFWKPCSAICCCQNSL